MSLHVYCTDFIFFEAQEDIGGGQKREEQDGIEEDPYNEEHAEQVSLHLLHETAKWSASFNKQNFYVETNK